MKEHRQVKKRENRRSRRAVTRNKKRGEEAE
jgi:hypothetical protein